MSSMKARHQLILMGLLIIVIIFGSAIGVYILVNPPATKQAVLIVGGTASGTKIADTWLDGNFTTDSGTSGLKSATQFVYLPQAVTGTPSINNQGSVGYSVKTITYSFQDVAKIFGVQYEALIYQANITVQIIATQTDGNAVFKINGPSSIVSAFTFQTEGQVQVPVSGITDITSELKANNAPYGTYNVKVTTIESWSLWTYNLISLAQIFAPWNILFCWITQGFTNPACEGIHQVQGPSTNIFSEETGGVTYGAVNVPTFYMATPNNPISVGTVTGQTAVFDLSFIPAGGFTGAVAVSFTGAPNGMTVSCQDTGCNNVNLPIAPVAYKVTVTSATQLGNYTITASGVSGSITRTGTFIIQVIQNNGANTCPPICAQANTVLAADVAQSSYAPSSLITVKGSLKVTNGQPVNGGEIDLTDQATGNSITKVATGSDGSFSATFIASLTPGQYAITVSFPGDTNYKPASVTVTYSINNLAPITLYIIIAIVAIIIIAALVGFAYMRKKPGMM